MSLLYLDGFDHFGTGSSAPGATGKWQDSTNMWPETSIVRTGQSVRSAAGGAYMTSKTFANNGSFVIGFAFQSGGFGTGDFLQVREGSTVHLSFRFTAAGLMQVTRGGTVIATATTLMYAGGWYYLEFKGTIHASTGSFEVKIDTVSEAALTLTGQNTQNGGTGVWDNIVLAAGGGGVYFDDLYVLDTAGAAPRNTFLGPIKVETLYPQTDAVAVGSNAGWTPSTSTDRGALVDEVSPNTTDYNSAATVGLKDTYNYPNMALSGTPVGIQVTPYCMKVDAGGRQICTVVRSGGTDYDGAGFTIGPAFQYRTQVWEQNPNPTPAEWTVAAINALQVGVKLVA